MGVWEILLIVFCVGLVISVAVTTIVKRKRGKTSCDCCDGNCACCSKAKNVNKKSVTKL